jgi:hypothetical protein
LAAAFDVTRSDSASHLSFVRRSANQVTVRATTGHALPTARLASAVNGPALPPVGISPHIMPSGGPSPRRRRRPAPGSGRSPRAPPTGRSGRLSRAIAGGVTRA